MSDPLATIPLSAIRVFEAAARLRSFTRAASELGMSQAAVSWQVKALEQRLALLLFRRLPREVALTPAGERLAQAATEAMRTLRSAFADLSERAEDVLAISTTQTMASQWLAPRLGAFQLAHPKIAVRLEADSRVVDLAHEPFDLAIRTGDGDWPGLEAVLLFPTVITALCTPQIAAGLGPRGPAALLAAPRIGLEEEWAFWFRGAGVALGSSPPEPLPRLAADSQTLEVAAALAGQGAVLASPIMFAAEIAAGRLVQPFDVTLDLKRNFWLAYARGRGRTRKIQAFRDWLLHCVAEDPAIARHTVARA